MLLVPIAREGPVPIYRQIVERIVELVDQATLTPGARLPPTREFARVHAVHRATVVRAYRDLRALGYLESRPGAYTTVRGRLRPAGVRAGTVASGVRWSVPGSAAARLAADEAVPPAPGDAIDFASHAADPTLAPRREVWRAARRVLAADRSVVASYPDPRGLPELRAVIARRMAVHGVAADPDEIVVTNGTQQALDLIFRMLLGPRPDVVVESPTYGMVLALLRLHGARVHPVPMAADGLDLDRLRDVIARKRPALVYTMPNFHNPTGLTTSQAHREALLAICEARRVPIVEDGFDEELKYSGPAVLPIKSIDARGVVLYLGTLSKVAFPGLRLGWIVAPAEAAARLTAVQRVSALGASGLGQAVAAEVLGSSRFEAHLRAAHRVYRHRLQTLVAGLEEHLPGGVRFTRPEGGYTVWLSVPGRPGEERVLFERIWRAGVKVVAGRTFHVRPTRVPHFRLSIAWVDEERIREGCRRLGRALR